MSDAQRKSPASSRDRTVGRDADQASRPDWTADLDVGRGALVPRADDPGPGVEYPDIPRRSIAFLVDLILIQTSATIVLQVTGFVAGVVLLGQSGVTDNALSAWVGFAIPTLIVGLVQGLIYVFFLRAYRATPGQVLLGIHTLRARDGGRLGTGRAFLRWLVTFMPAWAIAGSSNIGVWWAAGIMRSQSISDDAVTPSGLSIMLPVIWFLVLLVSMLVDARGRGLQDRIAGSVVVQES